MELGKIRDVFTEHYQAINKNEFLSQSLSKIKGKRPPVLVVVDDQGKYEGILSRRTIALSRVDPSTTKVKTLLRKAPKLDLFDSVSQAARLMIENELRELPVFRGEQLAGFVTNADIIHGAVRHEWGNRPITEIMTKEPSVLEPEDQVGTAIDLFQDQGFNHVPVMSEGQLVGIVSGEDIVQYLRKPKSKQTLGERVGEKIARLSIPVKDIMSKPVVTIPAEASLKSADDKMHKHDISALIVTNKKHKSIGIVTRRDFLEPLAQMDYDQLKLYAQFSIKDDIVIRANERTQIMNDFDSFAERYGEVLIGGALFVYMKSHGSSYKGDQLIHCRLQLRTRKGAFYSASEGWNVEQTFRMALDRLERQILRSKELEEDPQFAHSYLQRQGLMVDRLRGGE